MLNQLDFRKSHFSYLAKKNESIFLLKLESESDCSNPLRKYLNNENSHVVRNRYHCRNRDPWYSVKIGKIPDAFLHYMASDTPRIVINQAAVTSTNTIHRIYWKQKITSNQKRIISLGSLTTLSNLQSEILGRRLSGGLLKIEPSQAAFMIIPTLDIDNSDWKSVNSYLARNQIEQAIELGDKVILENGMGLDNKEIKLLKREDSKMKHYRSKRSL